MEGVKPTTPARKPTPGPPADVPRCWWGNDPRDRRESAIAHIHAIHAWLQTHADLQGFEGPAPPTDRCGRPAIWLSSPSHRDQCYRVFCKKHMHAAVIRADLCGALVTPANPTVPLHDTMPHARRFTPANTQPPPPDVPRCWACTRPEHGVSAGQDHVKAMIRWFESRPDLRGFKGPGHPCPQHRCNNPADVWCSQLGDDSLLWRLYCDDHVPVGFSTYSLSSTVQSEIPREESTPLHDTMPFATTLSNGQCMWCSTPEHTHHHAFLLMDECEAWAKRHADDMEGFRPTPFGCLTRCPNQAVSEYHPSGPGFPMKVFCEQHARSDAPFEE